MPNDDLVPSEEILVALEDLWAHRIDDKRNGNQWNSALITAFERGQAMPSKAAQLAMLQQWFPWLGQDESVDDGDVVQRLNEWHEFVVGTATAPENKTIPSVGDCTCHLYCGDDSHSGREWHTHEGDPCPLHPNAPMIG